MVLVLLHGAPETITSSKNPFPVPGIRPAPGPPRMKTTAGLEAVSPSSKMEASVNPGSTIQNGQEYGSSDLLAS